MLRVVLLVTGPLLSCNDLQADPFFAWDSQRVAGAAHQPHPAVVRITAPLDHGVAHGSGTLVAAHGEYGLVVTNWHVVRDAQGIVEVEFPGGFRSTGRSVKGDEDWDLAAVVIWRPPVEPVTIAKHRPNPGEVLTIAGYGRGSYRSATGRCVKFYAPDEGFPLQFVEVSVQARQGDSGGPIWNARGELAGVLFGASQGTTMGSTAPRLRNFLSSIAPDLDARDVPLLAADSKPLPVIKGLDPAPRPQRHRTASGSLVAATPRHDAPPRVTILDPVGSPPSPSPATLALAPPQATPLPARVEPLTWEDLAGHTIGGQLKTLLAIVGAFSLLHWFSRRLAAA